MANDELKYLNVPFTLADDKFEVDAEEGIIRGVSVIAEGPALGHGEYVDRKTLNQVKKAIRESELGVKARFGHPPLFGESTGKLLGRISNPRISGGKVRADLKFGNYSKNSPAGNLWDYVFNLADEDPAAMGMSIVFRPAESEKVEGLPSPAVRVAELVAADLVDGPAANPGGMFAAVQNTESSDSVSDTKEENMADNAESKQERPEQSGAVATEPKPEAQAAELQAPVVNEADVLLAERKRVTQIRALCEKAEMGGAALDKFVSEGASIEAVKEAVLNKLLQTHQAVAVEAQEPAGGEERPESLADFARMARELAAKNGSKEVAEYRALIAANAEKYEQLCRRV